MSSDDIAIRVSNLSKRYEIYNKPGDRLKQFIIPKLCRVLPALKRFFSIRTDSNRDPVFFNEFWALKDVSFEIKKGETVGIIGRNGAGKSTLLQLICGTLNPTAGEIKVNGRIAALLELGAGFNPEFTGRENVQMSCALLGMTPEETEAHFEEIAAFADIGEFIEQPVKIYSSGMYVRLAFAINMVLIPEVLIVDEALSVGDVVFQVKCASKMNEIMLKGTTIIFVSHDIGLIRGMCARVIYLKDGQVSMMGEVGDVCDKYLQDSRLKSNDWQLDYDGSEFKPLQIEDLSESLLGDIQVEYDLKRYGSNKAKIVGFCLLDHNKSKVEYLKYNQEVYIQIQAKFFENLENVSASYYVENLMGQNIIGSWLRLANHPTISAKAGDVFNFIFKTRLPLTRGTYSITFQLEAIKVVDVEVEYLDVLKNAISFMVMDREGEKLCSLVYIKNEVIVVSSGNSSLINN